MQESVSGRKLLKNKPLISNKLIIDKCYPKGSLGEEYKNYMIIHGFNADDRSKVKFNTDPGNYHDHE
jgi:ubiquinone biosynthesis protein Coq4